MCVGDLTVFILLRHFMFNNFGWKFYLTSFCECKLTWNAAVNNILC